MKKILSLFTITLLLLSCKNEVKRTDFIINGEAKDVYNGIRIHLNTLDQRGRLIPKQTAIVMNEKFSFNGQLSTPEQYFLTVNSVSGRFPLMLENSEMNLKIDKTDILNSSLTGSKSHTLMLEYNSRQRAYEEEEINLRRSLRAAQNNTSTIKVLSEKLNEISAKSKNYPIEFINKHRTSPIVFQIFDTQLTKPDANIEKISDAFNAIDDVLKLSDSGKILAARIESERIKAERNRATEIGKSAPNFEAPKADGTMVSLEDLKGKVTIIDFWAAWCGPCRRENPNVVKVYEKYRDKGLEIIGVSLDGQSRQKDPKKAWLDAIEKDKLTWTQVSHLKYFNDPIAQLYNIKSIPATFILDEEGKIVAKNLRGKALELKVKELLEQ